jgi:glycosyltransferase involved in cell wall biosynthesis
MPKISIVIPVYNADEFLRETLDSVSSQTFIDFECVIINDGSTDKSLDIVTDFVRKDIRFKCVTIKNSGCANIPRNIAVEKSIGEFIFNLDADDVIDSDCLRKIYQRQLQTNADIVLLRLIGCKVGLEGELYRLPMPSFDVSKVYTGVEACALTIGGWKITCNGMLVKKFMYEGVPVGAYMNSDELSSRYLLYKAGAVSFSDATYYYRNHLNSISRAVSARLFEKLIVDSQLEEFVNNRYSEESKIPNQMRNVRFFNLIYLQADFVKNIKCFSKLQRMAVKEIIKKSYKTQNFLKLTEELPKQFIILFLKSYQMFRINAIIYVFVKSFKGRKYILK